MRKAALTSGSISQLTIVATSMSTTEKPKAPRVTPAPRTKSQKSAAICGASSSVASSKGTYAKGGQKNESKIARRSVSSKSARKSDDFTSDARTVGAGDLTSESRHATTAGGALSAAAPESSSARLCAKSRTSLGWRRSVDAASAQPCPQPGCQVERPKGLELGVRGARAHGAGGVGVGQREARERREVEMGEHVEQCPVRAVVVVEHAEQRSGPGRRERRQRVRSTVDCTSERRRSFEDAPLSSADESAERRRCLAAEAAPVARSLAAAAASLAVTRSARRATSTT